MLAFNLANKNKQLAAIQYIRLLGLKNPESVRQENDGSFSHTNTKGKKRVMIPCLTFADYRREVAKHTKTKMQKCLGYYVVELLA